MNNPFENALSQLDAITDKISSDYSKEDFEKAIELLKTPQNVIKKELQVNGKNYTAYRSQHNDARGPFKGGIRFHPQVNEDEVKALSFWMSMKTAIANIPYGGGKGGVTVNPKELSDYELQILSKEFGRAVAADIGPWKDIPAPDVNTNSQIMAWMLDAYEKEIGIHSPATFTGKPIELGGTLGRTEATGRGGYMVLREFCDKRGLAHRELSIAVQGFGNVGYYFAKIASDNGLIINAVSDSKGGFYSNNGLDIEKLYKLKNEQGSFNENMDIDAEFIDADSISSIDVDLFVPAALENAIHEQNADKVKAKYILELANGPLTSEADKILGEKNVEIIPDVLANAGGVIVSYFEWTQNLYGYQWSEDTVNEELDKKISTAFEQIYDMADLKKLTFREAAFVVGTKRIIDAMILRGRV